MSVKSRSTDSGVRLDLVGGGVAVVTIDRPPANSLSLATRLDLFEAWRSLRDDDRVRAVVVTGQGDRYFSAGLDMEELAEWHSELEAHERREKIDELAWSPRDAGLFKPLIAAVNGFCLAGGMYLAAMCDVRIAANTAEFGVPEARWSHPAVFSWMLTRQMPLAIANEMVLWADRRFDAHRMMAVGFVNHVVPTELVLETAKEWALQVSKLPSEAVVAHKRMLDSAGLADREAMDQMAQYELAGLHEGSLGGQLVRGFVAERRAHRGDIGSG